MTLPKAIEIVELNIKEAGKKMPPDCLDALKVCCEAAKYIDICRHNPNCFNISLLPGETPETENDNQKV